MKTFTDIEQSKKLAEILPLESADMHYYKNLFGDYIESLYNSSDLKEGCELKGIEYIPAWSLSALMNMLPSEITERDEYSETTYQIDIRKYALTNDIDIYQIAYGNYHWHEDGSCSWSDMVNSGEREELIDAVFQMVIWLKENNKL